MKLLACAVRDSAANAYNRPFFVPSTGLAVRSFRDEVNRADAQNPMFAHPQDFELWLIGVFDEENGQLEGCPHERLARAQDVKESAK